MFVFVSFVNPVLLLLIHLILLTVYNLTFQHCMFTYLLLNNTFLASHVDIVKKFHFSTTRCRSNSLIFDLSSVKVSKYNKVLLLQTYYKSTTNQLPLTPTPPLSLSLSLYLYLNIFFLCEEER